MLHPPTPPYIFFDIFLFFRAKIQTMSGEGEKDVPQNTQDLTVFVQNLLQQMVIAVYYRRVACCAVFILFHLCLGSCFG